MKRRAADLTSHRCERAKTSSSTGHVHRCILVGGRRRGIAAVNGPTFLSSCQPHVARALCLVVQNSEGLGKPDSPSFPSLVFKHFPVIPELEMSNRLVTETSRDILSTFWHFKSCVWHKQHTPSCLTSKRPPPPHNGHQEFRSLIYTAL